MKGVQIFKNFPFPLRMQSCKKDAYNLYKAYILQLNRR